MENRKRIYLCLAHMSGNEMKYIQDAFDTNWVVPLGPNVNGFEEDLENFVGQNKEVVALSAGTAAVHLALIDCDVKAGDEVMIQTFTFCASSNPIKYLGAKPVFVIAKRKLGTWIHNSWTKLSLIELKRLAKSLKPSSLFIYMVCLQRLTKYCRLLTNTTFHL